MCELVVVNFFKRNFHISITAVTLMKYLCSERIYTIGAARLVGGSRYRRHRRPVWRYTTWRQKWNSTTSRRYFLATWSWVKILRKEIRYAKEEFVLAWSKDMNFVNFVHHDDLPVNVAAQGSLELEYIKKADHRQLSGCGKVSVKKRYYDAPATVWRQKQKKRKKRRGRIGEASHPGPGPRNSPCRLRSPSPETATKRRRINSPPPESAS